MRNSERQRAFTYIATMLGCLVMAAGIGFILILDYLLP